MTDNNRVDVFFYGSYMNFDVLMNLGISEREYHVAQLPGYELTIGSAANVVKNGLERVFGIVTQLTHDELDALYSSEAQAKLGAQLFDTLNPLSERSNLYADRFLRISVDTSPHEG